MPFLAMGSVSAIPAAGGRRGGDSPSCLGTGRGAGPLCQRSRYHAAAPTSGQKLPSGTWSNRRWALQEWVHPEDMLGPCRGSRGLPPHPRGQKKGERGLVVLSGRLRSSGLSSSRQVTMGVSVAELRP